ncbi:MAG TPA: tRNA glutamyl-Q(34) synthetase GluQRS [Thermoanaerobaculia bacterium]|nr:tRNA glutamyl-Q(34) synthetase GluQRS [Thermoanaerobaculia bacterium]
MAGTLPRGRFAPSPTGPMHVGGARTALAAWLSVRSRNGVLVWRVEDLDPPRVVPGMAEAHRRDLAWLGLDWDEGPDLSEGGGPHAPYLQSQRGPLYEAALARLAAAGRLFPCRVSRKDLQTLATAPHGALHDMGEIPYPATLRPPASDIEPGWLENLLHAGTTEAAVRFQVEEKTVVFQDRIQGEIAERVDRSVGDFVLRRRDGLWAYQLAVVVDDLAMGIDDVVRGADLLASTARQIQLIEALGGTVPAYAHVPLLVNARGEKLSKRDAGLAVATLRDAGIAPERVVGYLAFSLGLLAEPAACRPQDLLPLFTWTRIGKEAWILPEDLTAALRRMT